MIQDLIDNVLDKAVVNPLLLNGGERRKILIDNFQDKRLKNIDLIWTQTAVTCCAACASGWSYGFMSSGRPCPMCRTMKAHAPMFIDNEYVDYVHHAHVNKVRQYNPKYCTVRDMMTEEQCKIAGIRYYSPEKILDWAYELKDHAQHVMIIPKDKQYLKMIPPEDFMIGYSVPSTYGGTPMPITDFGDFKIHLLGGGISKQIALWAEMPDNVVSLDNNSLHLLGSKGQFWTMTGHILSLSDLLTKDATAEELGFTHMYNVSHICTTFSLGAVATFFGREALENTKE